MITEEIQGLYESCPTSGHATRSVCQPGFSGSQEGWLTTASGEFKVTELFHRKEEILDGGGKKDQFAI